MPSEKPVVVSPPKKGQAVQKYDLDAENEVNTVREPSEMDVQLYYYTITHSLKNYAKIKQHPELYRNSVACDRCYQICSCNEVFYKHKGSEGSTPQDITLCSTCFDENPEKDKYIEVIRPRNPETGLRWL